MAEIIRPMFTSLPLPKGVDADDLLGGYLVALEGLYPSTLRGVVVQLVKGTWRDEVKFCPRPPELANMVRAEQRRIDAINRPRLPAPAVVQKPYIEISIKHRIRADELQRDGYVLAASGVNHEAFARLAKNRGLPPKSIHLWAIDEVWTPANVVHLVDTSVVAEQVRKTQDREVYREPMTPERAAHWEKIAALPDAQTITAEQQAFRRKVEMDVSETELKRAAE